MKPIKDNSGLNIENYSQDLRSNVFAAPAARKSYQRLFEIAKLNFQSIDTPNHITKLLFQA